MNRRDRKVVIAIGAPKSGKTTVARSLLRDLEAEQGDERAIAVVDPGRQFRGGFVPAGGDIGGWLEEVMPPSASAPAAVRAILFDDGDSYLRPSPPNGSAERDLYLRHRWWRTDLIVTARRPQNLSPLIWSACSVLYLFRTNPADRSARERLDEFAPGVEVPREPFDCVVLDPYTGEQLRCRTKPNGGVEVLR